MRTLFKTICLLILGAGIVMLACKKKDTNSSSSTSTSSTTGTSTTSGTTTSGSTTSTTGTPGIPTNNCILVDGVKDSITAVGCYTISIVGQTASSKQLNIGFQGPGAPAAGTYNVVSTVTAANQVSIMFDGNYEGQSPATVSLTYIGGKMSLNMNNLPCKNNFNGITKTLSGNIRCP